MRVIPLFRYSLFRLLQTPPLRNSLLHNLQRNTEIHVISPSQEGFFLSLRWESVMFIVIGGFFALKAIFLRDSYSWDSRV